MKERQRAFSGLAAYSNEGYTLRVNDQSSTVVATVGSAELFDVLGATPLVGRTFRRGDDRPGAAPITVVSYGFWQQELGADPNVVGRRIEIDGAPVEVVGVMPRGFYFPSPTFRIWRPLMLDPSSSSYEGNGWLVLVGRERPGLSRGELDADIQAIARALGERFTYPEAWDKTKGAGGDDRCATTPAARSARPCCCCRWPCCWSWPSPAPTSTALVLARTTDRAEELALRTALGAGRGRLVRQIVTESHGAVAAGRSVRRRAGGRRLPRAGRPPAAGRGTRRDAGRGLDAVRDRGGPVAAGLGVVVALAPVRAVLERAPAGPGPRAFGRRRRRRWAPPRARRARGGAGGAGRAARGRRHDVHAVGGAALCDRHRLRSPPTSRP